MEVSVGVSVDLHVEYSTSACAQESAGGLRERARRPLSGVQGREGGVPGEQRGRGGQGVLEEGAAAGAHARAPRRAARLEPRPGALQAQLLHRTSKSMPRASASLSLRLNCLFEYSRLLLTHVVLISCTHALLDEW